MKRLIAFAALTSSIAFSGCGYHTVGAATHLPDGTRTLAIPLFATKTEAYHTETVLTQAVVREFAARARWRVVPQETDAAQATLRGTILKEFETPLTYNVTTQQASSYLITLIVAVTVTDADGKVQYENKNYVYREQYQATNNLASLIQEDPPAMERLSRNFARQLAGDVLESF